MGVCSLTGSGLIVPAQRVANEPRVVHRHRQHSVAADRVYVAGVGKRGDGVGHAVAPGGESRLVRRARLPCSHDPRGDQMQTDQPSKGKA
eukprot:COSAG04_NODE_2181_length_4607_cov_19.522099_7_plen_90_part_00